jgi:hypothetical protein
MDQCLTLSTSDLVGLCVRLSEGVDGLKTQLLVTALIAAGAAALTAWLSTTGPMRTSTAQTKRTSKIQSA